MGRDRRLRKGREFKTVLKKGRRWSNKLLVLVVYPNDQEVNRYGFSVGKRIGNAVRRNLVKRRLRGVAGELAPNGGWDIVVIVRESASKAPYGAFKLALQSLLKSSGLLYPMEAHTG